MDEVLNLLKIKKYRESALCEFDTFYDIDFDKTTRDTVKNILNYENKS